MQTINVVGILDRAPMNKHHILLVFWCSVIMLFDGYDMVIYGSLLPHLMNDWQLSPERAGVLGSASLIGMMVGAISLTLAADKLGRKKIILLCTSVFSIAVILNTFANTPTSFFVLRFFTGMGLGGAVPIMVTIIKEMAPSAYRNRLINFMLAMYGVGAILSGLAGLFVIPAFGWQSVFVLAGLSIFLLPLLHKTFPESVSFLIQTHQQHQVVEALKKLNPHHQHQADMIYVNDALNQSQKTSILSLFSSGRAFKTLLIWLSFAMLMLMVYGVNTWLPKLMNVGGYSLGSSITFLVVLNIGNIFGTMLFGALADKWGAKPSLIFGFLVCALSISSLGFHPPTLLLYLLLIIAGGVMFGSLSVAHALAADFYPTHVRSTGVGFAAAMGRFGAIAGPLFGGSLLAMQLPFEQNFIVFGLPGLIGAIAMSLFIQKSRSQTSTV